jgi:hypothetical protein
MYRQGGKTSRRNVGRQGLPVASKDESAGLSNSDLSFQQQPGIAQYRSNRSRNHRQNIRYRPGRKQMFFHMDLLFLF